jgi:hypothetical protein
MCRKNWTNPGHERILNKFWINKTRYILGMKNPDNLAGHIPDMKEFWTNSG